MKLEENMYVRTKYGIKQIYEIDEHKTKWKYLYKLKKQDGDECIDLGVLSSEDIIKASFNIIDLIEVGDYVNGYEINAIQEVNEYYPKRLLFVVFPDGSILDVINGENIKSIVTKEQIEQMSYKLGE